MPWKAAKIAHRGRKSLRAALVVLAVLAGGRTAWLARQIAADSPLANPAPEVAAQVTPLAESPKVRRLVAEIGLVCPSAAHELQLELAAHHSPLATGTITSARAARGPLRVAANVQPGADPVSGGWLVDPQKWFSPEDSAAKSTPAPEPAAPKLAAPVAQSATEPVVEPTEPATPIVDTTPVEPAPTPEQSPPVEVEPSAWKAPKVESPEAEPAPPVEGSLQVETAPLVETKETLPAAKPLAPLFALPSTPVMEEVAPPARAPAETPAAAKSFAPPPLGMPSPHLPSPHSLQGARQSATAAGVAPGEDPHAALLAENCFPSAKACAKCHEKIFHEWSASSHAYAMVSPTFQKFEQRITEISQGTVGYFCQRCHAPVSTSLCVPRDMPVWEMPEVAREGVTCVACHRVNQRYGKVNGERRVLPGDLVAPVYGGIGGAGVAEVIAQKNEYKVKTSPDEQGPGQAIHREGRYFDQLSASEFCQSCHQVFVHPGIKLEVVWEQYRHSPARRRGVTCQDCHMGKVPGVASGYERCAIADISGKKVHEDRQHANHVFYGPGYSIAHPGVFPFHLKADRWKFEEWLQFDWRAGWGTEAFEERASKGEIQVAFPPVWQESDDRYDAREIIDDNLAKLAGKTKLRRQVMENGSHVDGPFFANDPCRAQDLDLRYVVTNTNDGHNLPSGSLGAQPQLWANVVLIGPTGERLWETGYTDHYGDVCDIHSRDVRAGRIPFDSQLFNLQTMFLITGAVGTDREFPLPVNVDIDQLPFLRPGAIPISVTNHPPFIRMEGRSLAPLGKKEVKYRIPGRVIEQPGRYRMSFRLRSRSEPIYFMDFIRATPEMQRALNEGTLDVHPYSVEFDVR